MTVIATGPHIAIWINGHKLTASTVPRHPPDNPRRGLRIKPSTIHLQMYEPGTSVESKNIQIGKIKDE